VILVAHPPSAQLVEALLSDEVPYLRTMSKSHWIKRTDDENRTLPPADNELLGGGARKAVEDKVRSHNHNPL
jgi:hypothetical protein